MIIKIEIDVKPEELRSFLGLPDVVGIQEDILKYVRERMSSSAENFDPSGFVKDNVERGGRAWQRVLATAFARAADDIDPEGEPDAERPRRSRRRGSKKPDAD